MKLSALSRQLRSRIAAEAAGGFPQSLFARMVAPAVIDQIDPKSLSTGGPRREITTMFADLRGFTSFSASVAPEELADVFVFLLYLAEAAGIDLSAAVKSKLLVNDKKYPVDKSYNSSKKYTEL